VTLDREMLLDSLEQQRCLLAESVILTPVDSLPLCLADRQHTAFLHGLYLTDKVRDRAAMKDAVIQFPARTAAAKDLAAIHRLLADKFGGAEGSLRLLAGLQAHTATFMSVAGIGQTVMLLPEAAGGHFATHAILRRLGLNLIDTPVDYERLCIDRAATLDLIARDRPDFIFIDRSEGLRYEDFSFIGGLTGVTKIFDASQYVTPILTGRYESPLQWEFDLVLFTLHKSFPGPQKAGIVSRDDGSLWQRLIKGLSTLVSSSHAESSYLVGLSLLCDEWLERYAERMMDTALKLEAELLTRDVAVVPREAQGDPDWPATHHIWIRSRSRDEAFSQYEQLAHVNIHTNYRKLPYDLGYGLRLGTTFAAMAGVDTSDAPLLAEVIAKTLACEQGTTDHRALIRQLASEARARAILPPEFWLTPSTGARTDKSETLEADRSG
jgi:glycine hydroxymethyltransferase